MSRVLGWLLTLAWATAIFVASSGAGGVAAWSWLDLPGADKLAHAAAYAVLGGLLRLATGRTLIATALATGYGLSDEIHQAFVPGRAADPWDLLADAVGALLGAGLVGLFTRRSGRRTRPVE